MPIYKYIYNFIAVYSYMFKSMSYLYAFMYLWGVYNIVIKINTLFLLSVCIEMILWTKKTFLFIPAHGKMEIKKLALIKSEIKTWKLRKWICFSWKIVHVEIVLLVKLFLGSKFHCYWSVHRWFKIFRIDNKNIPMHLFIKVIPGTKLIETMWP